MFLLVSTLLMGCTEEEAKIEFSNLPPFSPIVDLQPSAPDTSDDLEAIIVADSIDPDEDAVTLSYLWYKNDVLQEDLTEAIVSSDLTNRGDIWTVAVISNDGSLNSADTRRSVTIRNTLPVIDSAVLEWVDAELNPIADSTAPGEEEILRLSDHVDQNIMVTVTGSDFDPNDELTYHYEWIVDGETTENTENILYYADMARGQDWLLRVTVNDGLSDSESMEFAFDFYNGIPEITEVLVSPAEPVVQDTISCEAVVVDEEEDEVTVSYSWTITTGEGEDAIVQEATGESLDTRSYASGSTIVCTAVANDGMDDSLPAESAELTLSGNSVPVLDSVVITVPNEETGAVVGDLLSCEATGTDADADDTENLVYSYVWTLGADDTEMGTESTFDTTALNAGAVVVCTATASDGEATSDAMSDEVTLSSAE